MWSSSADSIGYLLNQEVAQRLTEELLELLVEGEDAPHIVPFGRGNVRADVGANMFEVARVLEDLPDRKSTRLNSSHLVISYAVFCLKKKTNLRECLAP